MTARRSSFCVLVLAILAACDAPQPTEFSPQFAKSNNSNDALAQEVRVLAAARGVVPLPRPPHVRQPLVVLGQLLAFDKILSGNRNISCMSCHVARFGTSDAKSLSVGEGGTAIGPDRSHPRGVFIPRNAPPLFNLGALDKLFWDGRVQVDESGRVHSPAGPQLTDAMQDVFEFGAISALPMFPVTNRQEMRGADGNELAVLDDQDFTGIWRALMERVGGIPQYRALFEAAYPGTRFEEMTFAHAANAMAGFFVARLSTANSPWDRFLAGRNDALSAAQLEGAKTFMTIRCSLCHNGATLSDQEFHNVAVAQIGPGVGDGWDGRDDFGRERVTGDPADRYRFRTTPLRNVELTAPYGHDGAVVGLREFIEHYSESHLKLQQYQANGLEPLLRNTLVPNAASILATRDVILDGVVLPEEVVSQLMAYMSALTDDAARNLKHIAPARVPSGLPVDR